MQTHLTLEWGDGSYDFRLTWAGCASIEAKSGAGIQSVYERLMIGEAHLADVVEVLREGLLGGAGGEVDGQPVETTPAIVNRLIERFVTGPECQPFTESWTAAKVVMHTFMVGYEPAQKKTEEPQDGSVTSEST